VERALLAIPDNRADVVAPYRFNLSIRLGADEMNTPRHVAVALRRTADAIETGNYLDGPIWNGSNSAQVGWHAGCLPGRGRGRG